MFLLCHLQNSCQRLTKNKLVTVQERKKGHARWWLIIVELEGGEGGNPVPIIIPQHLRGIRDIRLMYWMNFDILQVPTSLNTVLKIHVPHLYFREVMHFLRAIPTKDTLEGPITLYKFERAYPSEIISSHPRKDAPDFLMIYEWYLSFIKLRFPFSCFQIEIFELTQCRALSTTIECMGLYQCFHFFLLGQKLGWLQQPVSLPFCPLPHRRISLYLVSSTKSLCIFPTLRRFFPPLSEMPISKSHTKELGNHYRKCLTKTTYFLSI